MKLGDRVRFTWHLTRHSNGRRDGLEKEWVNEIYPGQPKPEPREGVVVGVRTLSDGRITWGWGEEPGIYTAHRHFKAYLVAFDMRRNPVLVLPEHLELSDPAVSVAS